MPWILALTHSKNTHANLRWIVLHTLLQSPPKPAVCDLPNQLCLIVGARQPHHLHTIHVGHKRTVSGIEREPGERRDSESHIKF